MTKHHCAPMKPSTLGAALAMLLLAYSCPGWAQSPGSERKLPSVIHAPPQEDTSNQQRNTLEKIKKTGSIVLAVRESSFPFSYYNEKGNIIGYSVEICEYVAKSLRRKLNLPKLKVIYMPVQGGERMEVVKQGLADMECGVTTNTKERQKSVSFSLGIFATETRYLAPKDITIGPVEDLNGKRVATTANSISEDYLEQQKKEKNLKFVHNKYKDNKEGSLTVLDGVNNVYPNDDVLLYSQLATNKAMKEKLHVTGTPFIPSTYGIVLPRGDVNFKREVDNSIKEIINSGKIQFMYEKWFLSPVAPQNVNLNLPMNQTNKQIFTNPTDEAFF